MSVVDNAHVRSCAKSFTTTVFSFRLIFNTSCPVFTSILKKSLNCFGLDTRRLRSYALNRRGETHFGNDATNKEGQSAVGVGIVVSLLVHGDIRAFVQSSQSTLHPPRPSTPCSSGAATRHSTNNHNIPPLREGTTLTPLIILLREETSGANTTQHEKA